MRGRWTPLLQASAIAAALFLLLPILVVVPISLTPLDYLSLPEGGVSLRHYESLAGDPDWSAAIGTSLSVALISAACAVLLGTGFAIGVWQHRSASTTALRLMLFAPMIVPPIIYGVGIFRLWAELGLLDSYPGLLVVHTILGLPFVVMTVGTSLATLDRRMEQAARSLGARPRQIVLRVVLPNIVPGMAAGALFAFVGSWDEVVVTLMTTSRRLVTLQRKIWQGVVDSVDPRIAAVGTLLILVTIGLLLLERVLAGMRRS